MLYVVGSNVNVNVVVVVVVVVVVGQMICTLQESMGSYYKMYIYN